MLATAFLGVVPDSRAANREDTSQNDQSANCRCKQTCQMIGKSAKSTRHRRLPLIVASHDIPRAVGVHESTATSLNRWRKTTIPLEDSITYRFFHLRLISSFIGAISLSENG
jgi:hypothetical protein